MAISLQKGQRISLSKEAPGLTKMMCGLGWDVAKRSGGGFFSNFGRGGQEYDLDASVICLRYEWQINRKREYYLLWKSSAFFGSHYSHRRQFNRCR